MQHFSDEHASADLAERAARAARARRRARPTAPGSTSSPICPARARSSTAAPPTGAWRPPRRVDWAKIVYPDAEPDDALDRLWQAIAHVCRLDEDDPVAAWTERMETLKRSATALTERSIRRDPPPRAGHRPDRRPLPVVDLACGRVHDGRRPRALPEHPERGDLHDPRSAAGRRARQRDAAARALRLDHQRAPGRVRGRPRRQDRRGRERRDAAGRVHEGRRGLAPRRARARRRRGTDRPAAHGVLRHPARRERRQPHRARLRLRDGGHRRGREAADQREQDPHRLHDRQPRARRRRDHRPPASTCRCCGRASGRSSPGEQA